MERIVNLNHNKTTYLLALSRTAERAAYFGVHTSIMLYMIDGVGMTQSEAIVEYANPKYLATLISLAFLPAATFTSGLDITIGLLTRDAVLQVWIGMLALAALGFIILGIVRRASSKIIDSPDN